MLTSRTFLGPVALSLALLGSAARSADESPDAPPGFVALEAAGARIGAIRVSPGQIFDTADPKEDLALFRAANRLHVVTRVGVIERALLFKTGDVLSVRVIEETERLLRANRYLYDVRIQPVAWHDGVVDIEVSTRDTWSLDPGLSAGRSGGATTGGFTLREYNLLGTGTTIALGRSKGIDRTSTEFQFANSRAFGTRAAVNYEHARNSDGRRDALSIVRPFYALDSRWSAGASATDDDRIDSVYNAGNVVSQYRRLERRADVFGGWSPGLRDGWVQRFTGGLSLREDRYAPEPGRVAPSSLPQDDRLVMPFVRYELIEDRFERSLNRNLVGRPEFFALGFAGSMQLSRASARLGSTRSPWRYVGSIGGGHELADDHLLIGSAQITGEVDEGRVRRQRLSMQSQYYMRQGTHWLFFASVAGDVLTRPELPDALLLGGDNGLRGYPLRYQSGTRRALFTVEERFYTDLYIWQLFRVGGAAFLDVGRAWGGDNVNAINPGWLRNAGAGLRIVSTRSAFSNVLHIDLAFPIDATADINKVQFLVKTKTSF